MDGSGSKTCWTLVVFIGFLFLKWTVGYKPVIFMHGIFANAKEWTVYADLLNKHHPGTDVTMVEAFSDAESILPMWKQIADIGVIVENVMKASPDGVHMLCFSQGGLICRGLLEAMDHNVDTFIAMSSPQAGQFGDTDYLKFLFPNYFKDNIYKLFYSEIGQLVSVGNYWNDPHQQKLYKEYSNFLAVLNNQSYPCNPDSHLFKKRFLKLRQLVLIGGPDDGVITPWQSSHFAFYDESGAVVEMRAQEWYKRDSFGLKTLDERGAIKIHNVPGVEHLSWVKNESVFTNYILPYLD